MDSAFFRSRMQKAIIFVTKSWGMGHSQEDILKAVEKALLDLVNDDQPANLLAPVWYTLSSGGKRIRPVMCLAVYDWLAKEHTDLSLVMPVALSIEIFHNFTLLHDDVMDVSALRRGRETVWKKWDVNTAILSGDAMNILAYMLLSRAPQAKLSALLERFNEGALRVCKGQQWDMEFETAEYVSEEEYLRMIEDKTAALLEMSVRLGACLGSASPEFEDTLAQFAREVGIAFQLQDDYLDVYGTTAEFGKECGDDIVTNKHTYLSVLLQKCATEKQRERYQTYKKLGAEQRNEKMEKVMQLYDEVDVKSACESAIDQHLAPAEALLLACEQKIGRICPALRGIFSSLSGRRF